MLSSSGGLCGMVGELTVGWPEGSLRSAAASFGPPDPVLDVGAAPEPSLHVADALALGRDRRGWGCWSR